MKKYFEQNTNTGKIVVEIEDSDLKQYIKNSVEGATEEDVIRQIISDTEKDMAELTSSEEVKQNAKEARDRREREIVLILDCKDNKKKSLYKVKKTVPVDLFCYVATEEYEDEDDDEDY